MYANKLLSLFKKEISDFNFYIMDVGGRDGVHERWDAFKNFAKFILVEPDPEEAKRLKNVIGQNIEVVDRALWSSTGEININITGSPGCSSVLSPDHDFIKNFIHPERYNVVKNYIVPSVTINEFVREKKLSINFLKVDTQGAELEILKGATQLNGQILGMELEVEFAKIYKGQPTFRDVDQFVTEKFDLDLFDLRRTYWKRTIAKKMGYPKGQIIFGDALYLMSPETISKKFHLNAELLTIIFKCILIGMTYGYLDYCLAILKLAEGKISNESYQKIEKEIISHFRFKHISNIFQGRIPGLFKLLQWIDSFFSSHHRGYAVGDIRLGNSKQA